MLDADLLPGLDRVLAEEVLEEADPLGQLAVVLRERLHLRREVARDVLHVVGLVRPSEPEVEDVLRLRDPPRAARGRSGGCRSRGRTRPARRSRRRDGPSGCSTGSRRTPRSDRTPRPSRRGPPGSGARRPRAPPPCSRARCRDRADPDAREPQHLGGFLASPGPASPPARARSCAGSWDPRSPLVRISRCTSRPAAAHFASTPPAQISASSGCAKTPRTGPVRGASSSPVTPPGRARSARALGRERPSPPSAPGRCPSRRTPGRRCPDAPTARRRRTPPGTKPR